MKEKIIALIGLVGLGLIVVASIWLVAYTLWGILSNLPSCNSIRTEKLVSLKQNTGVKGGGAFFFFVGTAHVEGKDYFYYYSGSETAGYKLAKVGNDTEDVKIFEDAKNEDASVLINQCVYPNGYYFHVPKGSIIRDFTLTL